MYEGIMYFKNAGLGWDEKFFLKATTYAACRTQLQTILDFRLYLSPPDTTVEYAAVRKSGSPRDALPLKITYPVKCKSDTITPTKFTVVNSPNDAFFYKLTTILADTGTGEQAKSVTYYVRGLPDECVVKRQITSDGLTPIVIVPPTVAPTPGTPPTSFAEAVGNYLFTVQAQTRYASRHAKPAPDQPAPLLFETAAWTDFIFRGYTVRKCGRPFGQGPGRAPKGRAA